MHTRTLAALTLALCFMAACQEAEPDWEAIFPAQVGDYLRVSGPALDPETGVDGAVYHGPQGEVRLRAAQIGQEAIGPALAELPPGASEIGPDPALGMRSGVAFTFAGGAHAAWGNADWLFVVDAPDRAALAVFLAAYGF